MIKIKVSGVDNAIKHLKSKKNQVDDKAEAGINKATFYVQGQVKESIARGVNAPVAVDTGRFLNSVDIATQKDVGYVFSDINYAKFIEYGTTRMHARPHFRNTAAKEKHKVQEIIQSEVKDI